MAVNSQQFGTIHEALARKIYEVSTSSLQQQISDLTSLVRQMAIGNTQQAKACSIYATVGHPTNACPVLQEEQVNTVGGFPGQPRRYDPYSNTYNPGWRDHPNMSYGNRQVGFQQNQQNYQPKQSIPSNSGTPLEDIFKTLLSHTQQFQ